MISLVWLVARVGTVVPLLWILSWVVVNADLSAEIPASFLSLQQTGANAPAKTENDTSSVAHSWLGIWPTDHRKGDPLKKSGKVDVPAQKKPPVAVTPEQTHPGRTPQVPAVPIIEAPGVNPDTNRLSCDPIPLFRTCTNKCVSNVDAHETTDGYALGQWAYTALKACFNQCRLDFIESPTPGCIGRNGAIVPPGAKLEPTGPESYIPSNIERAKWWWSWWYYHHRETVWIIFGIATLVILISGCCFFGLVVPNLNGRGEDLSSRAMKTAIFLASLEWTPREIRSQLPWTSAEASGEPAAEGEETTHEALIEKRWATTTTGDSSAGGTEMMEYSGGDPTRNPSGSKTESDVWMTT